MCDRTEDDYRERDLLPGNLTRLTLELVSRHGRQTAVDLLRKFNVDRVPDLTIRQLRNYHESLLAELAKPTNPLPSQGEWDQHAAEYPNAHNGMRYRLDRIRRGLPPPRVLWRGRPL